ncbi:hypothetical protein G6O67_008574 [Ophiocordyceps sinensis]|uniref:Galactose-proton symport n=1 Tax=Ophiocordyceps sinensis TaxID=72228 RepID=A0A8H4LS37_9HYPO|nr:hypothetical protein G6O67_008574 [Ophiocordyceps sinensis]
MPRRGPGLFDLQRRAHDPSTTINDDRPSAAIDFFQRRAERLMVVGAADWTRFNARTVTSLASPVYCNHSCSPSLVFDMTRFEVRVSGHGPLSVGDALTFFYPSTEWRMVQPFGCECGADRCADRCLGFINRGYKIGPSIVAGYEVLAQPTRQTACGGLGDASGGLSSCPAATGRRRGRERRCREPENSLDDGGRMERQCPCAAEQMQ